MAFPSTDLLTGGKGSAQGGDAVRMTTNSRILSWGVSIYASTANSASLFLGASTGVLPTTTDALLSGKECPPGTARFFPINKASAIWFVSTAANVSVTWHAV